MDQEKYKKNGAIYTQSIKTLIPTPFNLYYKEKQ